MTQETSPNGGLTGGRHPNHLSLKTGALTGPVTLPTVTTTLPNETNPQTQFVSNGTLTLISNSMHTHSEVTTSATISAEGVQTHVHTYTITFTPA